MRKRWTIEDKNFIRANLDMTSRDIAKFLGRSVQSVCIMINKLGLTREGMAPRSGIKSKFTTEDIIFIKENVERLTNQKTADHLGKTRTVVRNKIYELGLKRNERADEWTADQQDFLIKNFRTIGDVELGEKMNLLFPDSKQIFGRRTIMKKRKLLGLLRSEAEIKSILDDEQHKARSNTILRNSGSLHYKAGWVASTLASKNHPERIKTFLKHPELIELKTAQLKLNRALKQQNNDNSSSSIN